MSVFITLRFKGDAGRLKEELAGRYEAINERARQHGCLHHQFLTNDQGEIMVLDEWESADGFQRFFAASPDIEEMMGAIGVTAQPDVTVWSPLETPDRF